MYHCIDCIACVDEDHPEMTAYMCRFDGQKLTFNPEDQNVCQYFHPEEYIIALNFDLK